ncbi:MAG: ferredoxin [Candidatus Gribaldobacteria bacterium]|nr:ferredoxin [Candidatus Gribaldobacteria bacterium]
MQIKIDQTKCIGCGTCCALCPDFFDLGDNNKAILKKTETENIGCAREAAEVCPAQCIAIINN